MDDILFQLKQLPREIISIIQSYISYDKQVLLNKSTYNKNILGAKFDKCSRGH